jgi:hypothetical protein
LFFSSNPDDEKKFTEKLCCSCSACVLSISFQDQVKKIMTTTGFLTSWNTPVSSSRSLTAKQLTDLFIIDTKKTTTEHQALREQPGLESNRRKSEPSAANEYRMSAFIRCIA